MSSQFQPSLFADSDTMLAWARLAPSRTTLRDGAWVDHQSGWISSADTTFPELVETIPWRAERREMYDRVVDVPRLVYTYAAQQPLPHPDLERAKDLLNRHYADELGEEFVTAGCCFYRDGRDSVAWHGDNIGRGREHDTMVAIISFGAPRKLQLRPRGGRLAHTFQLGHGDLVVMGGSCQRTWEHAVPKSARPVGPRISVQFRPRNVW